MKKICAILIGLTALAVAPAPAQDASEGSGNDTWLPSLMTEAPAEGFDLAVSMARRAVKTTQPNLDTLHALRPNYAHDAQSQIDVSGVIADYFATVAAANDYWREWKGFSPMSELRFPKPTRELAERHRSLSPDAEDAFRAFSKAVFAEGALDTRTKQLIAIAVAHVTQCPWCIEGHVKAARRDASNEQIMEAIWVAAEMRAGGAYAHSIKALELMDEG